MEAQTLLSLLLLPGILAVPANLEYSGRFLCSSHCSGSSKFQYEERTTYQYRYEITTASEIRGAGEGLARMEASADAYIHVLSKCEMALTLSNVMLKRSEPDSDRMIDVVTSSYRRALENNVLRFSFQDGRIDGICPLVDEEPFTINFKRGVLTAFQNSMSQHDRPETMNEIDVIGNCPTKYSISQRGSRSMQISKTKDLLGCTERYNYRTSLQSMPFHAPNAMKSLPLLKGSHTCTQTLSKTEDIVTQSICFESLVFRPFSKNEAGARTETTQKMRFVRTSDFSINTDGVFRKASLAFEHSKRKTEMDQLLWTTKEKLNELCRASVVDISPNVPALFADMVYLMRGLNTQDITDMWERVERGTLCGNNKERALKFLMDSLPMLGTSASVEFMTQMLLTKTIERTVAEMWIASFTFIQNPDRDMIEQLQRLLISDTYRERSLLPVTSLVNNFCSMTSDCMSMASVSDVIDTLNDILGRDCQNADKDLILTTLRAVSNVGYADQLLPVLDRCFSLSSNDMYTRVMAAQAYRGVTCNAKRDSLKELFMNKGEDSELRIAAFLSLMKCPTESILQSVRISLDSEPISQVGSFVWTYLTNLKETASPHKQAVREILEDEKLQKEYDMDKRKYSRNYEWSYFSDKFGSGAMAESNLIWSSSSYIPRSLMVNLTVDILGHSVNLFEAGARMQGLESFVMSYFGRGDASEKIHRPNDFNNPSRCVKKSKMNNMNNKHGVSEDELSASFYLRMFGNDLDFKHIDKQGMMKMKEKLNPTYMLASLLKGDKVSFSHSSMFLDSTVTVPTIGGLALELSVNGTASVELKATGKLRLPKSSINKVEMNFNVRPSGAVQLSGLMTLNAGVTKTGLRMVTTLHSSTAVSGSIDLINGQIMSASIDTLKEKLEVLDVKSKFFIIHDEIEEEQTVWNFGTVEQKTCSPESTLKAIGYETCTEFSYRDASKDKNAPYFPFTGPTSFSVVVSRKDVPAGFKLTGKYVNNPNSYTGHVSFSTPGSQEDRTISTGYFLDTKDKSLELELTSPWKQFLLKGAYVDKKDSKSMQATIMNDRREYTLEAKAEKQKQAGKTIWSPSIKLARPTDSSLVKLVPGLPEKFTMNGNVVIDSKYTELAAVFNISSGLKPDPITLRGNFINKKMQKAISATAILNKRKTYGITFQALTSYSGKRKSPSKIQPTLLITVADSQFFLLDGYIGYKPNKMIKTELTAKMEKHLSDPIKLNMKILKMNKKDLTFKGNGKLTSEFAVVKSRGLITIGNQKSKKSLFSSRITTTYVLPKVKNKKLRKNSLVFSLKVNDRSTSSITKYFASMNLDSKKYQDASFLTTLDVSHKSTFTKTMMTFKHKPKVKNMKDKANELRVGGDISHKISKTGVDIRYELLTVYPIKNIEYRWNGKHEHHLGKLFSFETYNMIVLPSKRSIELRLKGDNRSKKLLEAYGNMDLSYPSFTIGEKSFDSQSYKLTTIIQQTPSKEYIHTVNLQTKEGVKHVMLTSFRKSRNNNFDFKSDVEINGEHKSKLTLKVMKEDTLTDASILFHKDNKIYKGQVSFENVKNTYVTLNMDVLYPERRIITSLEGGTKDGKNIMFGQCSWDADRDASKKVEVDLQILFDVEENNRYHNMEYKFKVITPFERHTIYQISTITKSSPEKIHDEFTLVLGTPEKEYSYKYWFTRPFTFERYEMLLEIKTPYENLRNFHSSIKHKFDGSKYLSSLISGKYNEHEISVTVKIANRGDLVRNQLESSVIIVSSFPKYKSLTLEFNHNDDGRLYASSLTLERNDQKFKISLDSEYLRVHWQVKMFSTLEIFLPKDRRVTFVLDHDNSLTNLDSTITGKWWDANQAKLIVGAKFNKAEKDYGLDITYSGTLGKVQSLVMKGHHNEMNGYEGLLFVQINNDPKMKHEHKYRYTNTEMTFEGSTSKASYNGEFKFENYPYTIIMKHSTNGNNPNEYLLDATIDKSENGWTSDMKLVTPLKELRNVGIKGNLREINQVWTFDSQISLDVRKLIKVDFSVDIDRFKVLTLKIESPFEKMYSFNFGSLREKGRGTYNSTIFIEIQPIFNMIKMSNFISNEINFNSQFTLDMPDKKFKHMKIIVNNVEQKRGGKTHIKIKYHPHKEIDLKLTAKYNKRKFPEKTKINLDFSSPFEILRTFNMKTNLHKNKGKWIANMKLDSSNEKLKSLDVNYDLAHSETSVDTSLNIDYPLFGPIYTGVILGWGDEAQPNSVWGENILANFTIVTPKTGRTVAGIKLKSKSWLDFQEKIFAEHDGHELDIDIGLKHDKNTTKAWLTYMMPGANTNYIKTSVHKHGHTLTDFDVGSYFQVGKTSPEYNMSMQYAFTEEKTAAGLTFITPHTEPFSYLAKSILFNSPERNERENTGYLMFGKKYLIDTYEHSNFNKTSFEYEFRGEYIIDGQGHKAGSNVNANWNEQGEEVFLMSYYDINRFQIEGAHVNARTNGNDKETLDIMVSTPYEHFNDVGLQAHVFMRETNYAGECTVEYMDGKEAELTYELSMKTDTNLNLDATLTIPESEYETNTLKYTQNTEDNKITSEAKLVLGDGKQASGSFEFKNKEEFIITLKGPIKEFVKFTLSGKYIEEQKRLNGDMQLFLTLHPKPASLDFDIFINNEPITLNFKLKSPYDNFRKSEITLKQTGNDWKNFKTESIFISEVTGKINSEIMFDFISETEMDGQATLTSTLKDMENLKLLFNSKKMQDNQVSHLEVGWDVDKEIIMDSTWSMDINGRNNVFKTDFEMATPFKEIKSASLKFSHQNGRKNIKQYITVAHNGKTHLDTTISYQIGEKHIGSVDVRYPRPMAFDLEAEAVDQTFDGKLKMNWDKHSPESLFEFVTKISDKSMDTNMDKDFSFKLIHPVRVMGIDGQIRYAEKEILSSGQVTWDERKGKTFSYDVGYSDHSTKYSQMFDGHVKVGVPQRSVRVEGSHRDTGKSKTIASSIFWDADKDETKKVVLSTTTERQDRMERVSLNLNIPYINKQMNMGITRKLGYGSSILESEAEISYSSNPRKNIIITTKIDNTEMDLDGLGNFNYTVDVRFSHKITGMDIRWESHLGQVKAVSSTGSRITYMTTNKEKKVFAFWSQHDSDERRGQMMIMTPLKTLNLDADIDSSRGMQSLKFSTLDDGKEALKLEATLDPRRRNMEVDITYDRNNANKMLTVSGSFVNEGAVQVNVITQDGHKRKSESQIDLTLNTSRIMHTRIQWRPELPRDIQVYLSTEAAILSHTAREAFSQTMLTVGGEVRNKYARVSKELRDETKQVFELMEKEMDGFSTQLENLRTAYRRFYQNNNFGIIKMGETINAAFVGLCDTIQDLVKEYRAYYTGITKATNKWLNDLRTYPVMQKYLAASNEFIEALQKSRAVIENMLEELSKELEKFSEETFKLYSSMKRKIDRKLNSYSRMAHELPKYKQMMAQREFMAQEGGQEVSDWLKLYERLYLSFQEMVQDQYKDMMSRKEFREMYAVGAEIHQQLMHYSMEPNIKFAIKRVVDLSKNLILMEVMKMKNELMDLTKTRLIVYDPENGELQFEIHQPFQFKSFAEPPNFKGEIISKLRSLAQVNMPSMNYSIWDSYYKYMPSLKPSDWLPPFKATGYVIGSQHIFTFDKTHYEFFSTCGHVLARDMVHDSFSVVLNYNRNQRQKEIKSICMHFEHSQSIMISTNYELKVNNKETEMPYYSDIVTVIRDGDLITVKYVGGVMVVSNPRLDLYKVTLSGWFHGRTAGLLGDYNNEMNNDERLPLSARNFEVDRKTCRTTTNLATPHNPDDDQEKICVKLFEENSSKFRPCFKQVNPSDFLTMCQYYMGYMSMEDAVHKITEQYRFVCRDNGVYMGPLKEYVPCNKEKPILVEDKDTLYHSADFVFVVQDNKCNQWTSSSLGSMVTEINNALNTADMKNNRFGLLGVRAMNPTVRTMNGHFFGQASHFLKAAETLQLTDEDSAIDLSETIRMAMRYPYRVGVAKVLVIAPCSTCQVGIMDRNLDSSLKYHGFRVHILKQMGSYEQSRDPIILQPEVSNSIPSLGNSYLNFQNDYCETIAGTTMGQTFDVIQLTQGKGQVQKELIQYVANQVGWSTKLPACQKCECNAETGLSECHLCETNTIYDYIPPRLPNLPSLPEVLGRFHDVEHYVMSRISE